MNYLVNPGVFEEINERKTDPLTRNIIGAAIDVYLRIYDTIRRMKI